MEDANRLQRFTDAQDPVYATVLKELESGEKESHWMWFIFPQIQGLGHSPTSRYYGITGIAEARAYLQHPILGARLRQCCQTLLQVQSASALDIFGAVDEQKLHASMTLFSSAADFEPLFEAVLDRYFEGRRHSATLSLI